MKRERPISKSKTSFVDLDRRVEYASPYRQEQQRQVAVRGMVCHLGEMVSHNEEVVTV